MILHEHQIAILQEYSISIWLASCSPNHSIDILRLTGARVTEDKGHLDLFAPQQYTETFFKNIQENPQISFMFASILTFEAFQVKGTYLSHRPCTPEEERYQKAYVEGCSQTTYDLGVKAALAFTSYYKAPTLVIRMKAAEVYEQTPKAGTGTKINQK